MLRTMIVCGVMLFSRMNLVGILAAVPTPLAQKIEAVIFDCDGVLVDTEHLKFLAWQQALNSVNVELSLDEYMMVAGHSSETIRQLLEEMKRLDISEDVIPLKRLKYQELQIQGVPPIEGAIAFVRYLSQNKDTLHIKLGLASSASRNEILMNLKQIELEHEFDLIISGSDDLGSYVDDEGTNKPKPYIYIEAAKRLGIPPTQCLVFEDTEAGIEAAAAAGMIAVAIPNRMTKDQNFSKADQVIDSISSLMMHQLNHDQSANADQYRSNSR